MLYGLFDLSRVRTRNSFDTAWDLTHLEPGSWVAACLIGLILLHKWNGPIGGLLLSYNTQNSEYERELLGMLNLGI